MSYQLSRFRSFKILPDLGLATLLVGIQPSQAATLQQIQDIFNSVNNYIHQQSVEFSQSWGELSSSVQTAIDNTTGDLGIPDPVAAGKQVEDVISGQDANVLTTNPSLLGYNARAEWNQQYTQGQSESTLGNQGQAVMKTESDASQDALATTSENASAAQQDIITQDIMKKIAIQNAQQAVISKSIQTEAQQQTQTLAAANLNLADMSGRMNEQERRQQFEDEAQVRQTLAAAAFNDGFWAKETSGDN
jgi:hypothetical protein